MPDARSYSRNQRHDDGDHSQCFRHNATNDPDELAPIPLCAEAAELIETARAVAFAKARIGIGAGTDTDRETASIDLPDFSYLDAEPDAIDVLRARAEAKQAGRAIPDPDFAPTSPHSQMNLTAFASHICQMATPSLLSYRDKLTGKKRQRIIQHEHRAMPGNTGTFTPDLPRMLASIDAELENRGDFE